MSTYTIHVDHQDFTLSTEAIATLDLHQTSQTDFHLLKDNQAFNVKLLSKNILDKTMTISVNGNRYEVKIDDAYDTMVAQMGLLEKTETLSNDFMAPMPGYIVEVLVKPGDAIEEGTPLFVLSAMKMENTILADGIGTVKSVEVKVDDSVVKGQLIIAMES